MKYEHHTQSCALAFYEIRFRAALIDVWWMKDMDYRVINLGQSNPI
jgi:hypothetical protein